MGYTAHEAMIENQLWSLLVATQFFFLLQSLVAATDFTHTRFCTQALTLFFAPSVLPPTRSQVSRKRRSLAVEKRTTKHAGRRPRTRPQGWRGSGGGWRGWTPAAGGATLPTLELGRLQAEALRGGLRRSGHGGSPDLPLPAVRPSSIV